jgi:cytochrome P450
VVGALLEYTRDPLNAPLRWVLEHGEVIEIDLPGYPLLIVADPDQVERVLVKEHQKFSKDKFTHMLADILGQGLLVNEGASWRRQRGLVQPVFHHRRIKEYADVFVGMTAARRPHWRAGEVLDVHREMMHVTLAIVAKTLFDADVSGDAETVASAIDVVSAHLLGFFQTGYRIPQWVPTPSNRRFAAAVARIDEIIYRLIAEREAQLARAAAGNGERADFKDLLGMLLSARDEAGQGMDRKQLRDEAVTLFLAGHETTALALTFALRLLSLHPEVDARLHEELTRVLGGRPATLEDLPQLRYLDWVVTESMRLYPPAWAVGRTALEDCEIGGYLCPKGRQVMVMTWINHRLPRFFENPEAFRPERWDGDLARRLPRFAYFPFGGGPRICIGNAFAKLEAQLALATAVQRHRFVLLPGQPLSLAPTVTLRPKHPIMMRVEPR